MNGILKCALVQSLMNQESLLHSVKDSWTSAESELWFLNKIISRLCVWRGKKNFQVRTECKLVLFSAMSWESKWTAVWKMNSLPISHLSSQYAADSEGCLWRVILVSMLLSIYFSDKNCEEHRNGTEQSLLGHWIHSPAVAALQHKIPPQIYSTIFKI